MTGTGRMHMRSPLHYKKELLTFSQTASGSSSLNMKRIVCVPGKLLSVLYTKNGMRVHSLGTLVQAKASISWPGELKLLLWAQTHSFAALFIDNAQTNQFFS